MFSPESPLLWAIVLRAIPVPLTHSRRQGHPRAITAHLGNTAGTEADSALAIPLYSPLL